MQRRNPYESAFEAYLRDRRLGYIAVDEAKRAVLGDDGPVKSLDFIVYGPRGARLLIDVKGRRFPGGTAAKPRKVWETWTTRSDLDGLARWEERFGAGFVGLFVFLYQLQPEFRLADDTPDLWTYKDKMYLVRAVSRSDYAAHHRTRSPRWDTVCLPVMAFREVVRPFWEFTHLPRPARAVGAARG